MSKYYSTDSSDPFAPIELEEYQGINVGDTVTYANAEMRGYDPFTDITLTVSAFYRFTTGLPEDYVAAILNDGDWEVSADNLILERPNEQS